MGIDPQLLHAVLKGCRWDADAVLHQGRLWLPLTNPLDMTLSAHMQALLSCTCKLEVHAPAFPAH